MEYTALADLVGVKITDTPEQSEPVENESVQPSSGMISQRRRAAIEIEKKIQHEMKLSQDKKQ